MSGLNVFVTVGTQLPFDRLVAGMQVWAEMNACRLGLMTVQTGKTRLTVVNTAHIVYHQDLGAEAFGQAFDAADVVVSHAGMGTIIRAADAAKPLVIMPRLSTLGEHRNDHQLGTATKMARLPNVHVCLRPSDLDSRIDAAVFQGHEQAPAQTYPNRTLLVDTIRSFVTQPGGPRHG